MITDAERSAITALIRSQVVPAIGCTEPVSVALCVSRASALMGRVPDSIELSLSLNILKNAMGVGIPGTGMVGLPIAVALGAIVGRHELGLEVLRYTDAVAVEKARRYVGEGRIKISLEEHDTDKLFIRVLCRSGEDETEAIIKRHHTDFVYLRKNADVMLEKQPGTVSEESICVPLTLRKVYEYATTTCTDDMKFILEAKKLNENAAQSGLTENYGHALGKTLCSPLGRGIMGEGIFSRILSVTSCACDARMAGAMVPVMSNSGSGNQGICATMPVVVFAEENHNTEEELIRALVLSNLTAIYIKQALGTLSALCGCVVASTGSSCGITYLMGGTYEQVAYSVKNMIANLTGMICDGAKPSCALKLTTGVGTAVMSAMLAIQNKHVTSVEGIIDDDVDRSIHNLTDIGSRGMSETDRFVMNIMTNKTR